MMFAFKLLAVSVACAAPAALHAQDWTPPGPIKLMIGFSAGGGADSQARLVAQAIEEKYGWTILPEQVLGNSGMTLTKELASQPNDGTAIGMIVTETLTYSPLAMGEPSLAADHFTPLATTGAFQTGLVAMKDGKFDSWEKVTEAAAAGEPIRFGVATERWADVAYLLGKNNGIDFNLVQVAGGADIMSGLRGHDIDIGWVAGNQVKPVIQGEMVDIANASGHVMAQSPDAPEITDLGSNYDLDGYFMFVAPPDLDPAARKALGNAIADVMTDPSTQAHALAVKSFGGPDVITGSELESVLARLYEEAKALLTDASN